jgi:hypothetical protein
MPVRVTLSRGAQVLTFPSPGWVALVNLAVQYGWKPSPASQGDRDEAFVELFLVHFTAQDEEALADAVAVGGPYLSCPPGLFEGFLSRTDRWSRT